MATLVLPGQPLSTPGTAAQLAPGPGTYTRGGQVYAALVGKLSREGGVRRPALHLMLEDIKVDRDARPQIVSVKGKEETQAIPEPNATVRPSSCLFPPSIRPLTRSRAGDWNCLAHHAASGDHLAPDSRRSALSSRLYRHHS